MIIYIILIVVGLISWSKEWVQAWQYLPMMTIFIKKFATQFQTLLFENIGINLLTKVGHSKGIDLTQPSSKTPVSWERIVGEEWMPSHRENELSHWQVDQ